MDIKNITIKRVMLENDYYIDISPGKNIWEYWLYNKHIAQALYMFGIPDDPKNDVVELAISNAPEYIYIFEQEYQE